MYLFESTRAIGWKIYALENLWGIKALQERGFIIPPINVQKLEESFFNHFLSTMFGEDSFKYSPVPYLDPGNHNKEEHHGRKRFHLEIKIPELLELHGWVTESEMDSLLNYLKEVCHCPLDEYSDSYEILEDVFWLKETTQEGIPKTVGVSFILVDYDQFETFEDGAPGLEYYFRAFIKFWDCLQQLKQVAKTRREFLERRPSFWKRCT
jgi:hypothetical protein